MARGRGGSVDLGSLYVTTRRRDTSPYYDPLDVGYKAHRIGYTAGLDAAELSKKSRDRDRKLLSNITQRLNRIEYDDVRPSKDVAVKTGFRRYLYNPNRVPIEKETRQKRRRDELRYPWDNTKTDNFYRGVCQKKTLTNKRLPKKPEPKAKDYEYDYKHFGKREYSELPVSLPEYDPMAVYRPREKRERKNYDQILADLRQPIYDMSTREMVARTRAKVEAMPRHVDTQRDVDAMLAKVLHPLPKNNIPYTPLFTTDGYYEDVKPIKKGIDGHLKSKFDATYRDIDDFDKMLDMQFQRRKKSVIVPSRIVPRALIRSRVTLDNNFERELGVEPCFDEPTVIHRHSRPSVRVSPAPIRSRAVRSVHATPTSSVRVRSSSVPASARVAPSRNRSRIADLENIYYDYTDDYGTDWAYTPVVPYTPAPISTTSPKAIRARAALANPATVFTAVSKVQRLSALPPTAPVTRKKRRMPELDPYRPSQGHRGSLPSSNITPYTPAHLSRPNPVQLGPAPRGNFRPHVSETRRRIRDVICSSRKDPHYFA